MSQNRREFIERLTTGAMMATVPFSADALRAFERQSASRPAEDWDV